MPTPTASPAQFLARGWSEKVRSAALDAISLAASAMTTAWSRAATSRSSRRRLAAEVDRLRTEFALLTEELDLKDARWARCPARRRPHYGPIQRMRILRLRAARGWSAEQAAKRFLVTEDTIASWIRRVDEGGERALVQLEQPVNKFPEFVAQLVRRLKLMCPALGKVRIAQMLARAGLHISASTVGRMLRRGPTRNDVAAGEEVNTTGKVVTAKYPNHVWHVDLTTVPTSAGFWVPWLPFAKLLRWPFCWWVAIVLDHASRLVVGFAVFERRPTADQVLVLLNRATKKAGARPRHIITDKGKEFFCAAFQGWCRRYGVRPRFGAVGKHGSIAIIERAIRSMKSECTRRIVVPLQLDAMRYEIACHAIGYNEYRPHRFLGGRTPLEVYRGLAAANESPRFEPRARWPRGSSCASPAAPVTGRCGVRLLPAVGYVDDRPHLPVVGLKTAA